MNRIEINDIPLCYEKGNKLYYKKADIFHFIENNKIEKIKKWLNAYPFLIHQTSKRGINLLHFAVVLERTDIIKYLVRTHTYLLNSRLNNRGLTPLGIALVNKCSKSAKCLVALGANCDLGTHKKLEVSKAMMRAIDSGRKEYKKTRRLQNKLLKERTCKDIGNMITSYLPTCRPLGPSARRRVILSQDKQAACYVGAVLATIAITIIATGVAAGVVMLASVALASIVIALTGMQISPVGLLLFSLIAPCCTVAPYVGYKAGSDFLFPDNSPEKRGFFYLEPKN